MPTTDNVNDDSLRRLGRGDLVVLDLANAGELWREYDFLGRVYRIEDPFDLYFRPGGTTHRVVDNSGAVHIVPAPGHFGCVIRYKKVDGLNPVDF